MARSTYTTIARLAQLPRRQSTPAKEAEATAGHYTARRRSTHAHQLLQRSQLVIRLRAKEDWPIGVGDFGDIDVAARIQRDAVGCDELAQPLANRLSAEMGQSFPLR